MDVKLPKLGEGADTGTVVGLLVKVGDIVKKDQPLLELENEKAIAPIPSPAAGQVTQIYVKEGQKITLGQRLLALATATDAVAPTTPATPAVEAAGTMAKAPPPTPEVEPEAEALAEVVNAKPAAAPSIRKLARELGLDLTQVRGSARGGRIVMDDLRNYIQQLQRLAFASRPAAKQPALSAAPPESVDFSQWGPITRKPISSLRSVISRRMVESWSTIPHVAQFDEADITDLLELRKKYSAAYEAKGARLTLTPFTLKAAVMALKQSPIFNASLDETSLVFKAYYHLGLAVDTEAGLIVPVIRDVDKKGLLQLARELQELAQKTRARKVTTEELKGGTFTISNQGGIGGSHFTPIINQPQVAILGIGRSVLKPVVRQSQVEPRTMLPLTVCYDHRLIDGGAAARFIVQIVQALEGFPEAEVKNGVTG